MNDKIVNPKLVLSSLYGKCVAETDYIERDSFLKLISHKPSCPTTDREDRLINGFISAVKNFPAADVRPVVTCIECKHSCDMPGGLRCCYGTCVDCFVDPEFFCADGEKREES